MGMYKDKDYEDVVKFLEENDVNKDCTLISTSYVNNTTPLSFKCNLCGKNFERDFAHLKIDILTKINSEIMRQSLKGCLIAVLHLGDPALHRREVGRAELVADRQRQEGRRIAVGVDDVAELAPDERVDGLAVADFVRNRAHPAVGPDAGFRLKQEAELVCGEEGRFRRRPGVEPDCVDAVLVLQHGKDLFPFVCRHPRHAVPGEVRVLDVAAGEDLVSVQRDVAALRPIRPESEADLPDESVRRDRRGMVYRKRGR